MTTMATTRAVSGDVGHEEEEEEEEALYFILSSSNASSPVYEAQRLLKNADPASRPPFLYDTQGTNRYLPELQQ